MVEVLVGLLDCAHGMKNIEERGQSMLGSMFIFFLVE